MRVGMDATAAAVQFAGVGRYARELLRALVALSSSDEYALLCAAPPTQAAALLDVLPPGAERRMYRLPFSERLVTAAWQRFRLPVRAERIVGKIDVFHGPDFVVPPSSAPRVVTIHDLSFVRYPELGEPALVAYLQSVVPRSIDASERVIAVSTSVAAELVDEFPHARDKIVAIPNGVRAPDVSVLPDRCRPGEPDVLIVGTIEPRKNHLTLLDAMRIVRSRHPNATLTVAGRVGWRADDIVARLQQEEASGHVRLVLAPPDDVLDNLYRQTTVFAYPSMYEGFGLPVLEAMARGVPVVAGDIPALRESGGSAALFAAPNDADALAAQIIKLIDDVDAREMATARGIAHAGGYSWRETAQRTQRVYQQAAG
jgi:glycosyltransferase involved in cell wall biosynthesis